MRKVIIALLALLCFALVILLFSNSAFAYMTEDGLLVPRTAGIEQKIASDGAPIPLTEGQFGEMIYSGLMGYFLGEDRTEVDLRYPSYVSDGAVLRFWGEDSWLIDGDVMLTPTFEGMYLSGGYSFNADMTQADPQEFILVALPNGLYMNTQPLSFDGLTNTFTLPANSILSLDQELFSWYYLDGDTLVHGSEDKLFLADVVIGSYDFTYMELLDILGLLRKAISGSNGVQLDTDPVREAQVILQNKGNGVNNAGAGTGGGTTGNTGAAGAAGAAGGTGGTGSAGAQGGGAGGAGGGTGGTGSAGGQGGSGGSGGGAGGSGGSTDARPPSGSGSNENSPPVEYVPYTPPEISIRDLDPWSYALGLHMDVKDETFSLYLGVNFSIYQELRNSGGKSWTENGYKMYSADGHTGRRLQARGNKASTQTFALSTLPSDTKLYLQYSYRYLENVRDASGNIQYKMRYNKDGSVMTDDAGNPVYDLDQAGRKQPLTQFQYFTSDFYEFNTKTIQAGNVQPLKSSWQTTFAHNSYGLELQGLTLANQADYDPDLEVFDFANFKKNTLPYVQRLEIELKPEGGIGKQTHTMAIGGSALSNAKLPGGTNFESVSPRLDSNTEYTYTVTAKDRYGKILPLNANGQTGSYTGTLYTRKAQPSILFTEVENVTDSLTIQVEVVDKDKALVPGESLYLTAVNNETGLYASFKGSWDPEDNVAVIDGDGGEDTVLELKNPDRVGKYTLKIDSLAFAQLYDFQVHGSMNPQPDRAPSPSLGIQKDVLFGEEQFYTASLASGLAAFRTAAADVGDTYATLEFTMTRDSTVEMMSMIDQLRIYVRDPQNNVVSTVILNEEDLNSAENYSYSNEDKAFTIPTGAAEPTVQIVGTEKQVVENNPWKSLLITRSIDESGKNVYSSPMTLRIALPKDSLLRNTRYRFTVEAVVIKSNQESQIPVRTTVSAFTTKKTLPVVKNTLIVAGSEVKLLDLKVIDPDGTVMDDGALTVYLYKGSTIIGAERITAVKTDDAPGKPISFSGLLPGEDYSLEIVAKRYNDTDAISTQKSNYVIESYQFKGSRDLYGDLNLTALDADKTDKTKMAAKVTVDVQDIRGYLTDSSVTLTLRQSDVMENPQFPETEAPYFTDSLKLGDSNGIYSLLQDQVFSGLPANDAWQLTLSAEYYGIPFVLDQITFYTDNVYTVVYNHVQMVQAQVDTNGKGHILVAADFDMTTDVYNTVHKKGSTERFKAHYYSNFQGTIDFQGHVVTRADGMTGRYFLDQHENGSSVIRNLVFELPATESGTFVNGAAIFCNLTGTVENLMVRTNCKVVQEKNYAALIAYKKHPGSVLRNFIVKLGGDLVSWQDSSGANQSTYAGALFYENYGHTENGYVYGVNGAGFIARNLGGSTSLMGIVTYSTTLRNVYVILDTWMNSTMGGKVSLFYDYFRTRGIKENGYFVGDFYIYETKDSIADESKSYASKTQYRHVIPDVADAGAWNLWSISQNTYSTLTNDVNVGTVEMLSDAQWQKSVLKSGFEVEKNVEMGFYPRLELPACMEQHQEYLPLPTTSESSTPQIVGDGWADESHGLDSGKILLTFKNDIRATITGVTIPGLEVTVDTKNQTFVGGLYQVPLTVVVDEDDPRYMSTYPVSDFTYTVGGMPRTVENPNYTIQNVEFWKEIATVEGWTAMNDNMAWNYKLTADLDMTGRRPDEIQIPNIPGTYFTGKLDGQEHVVANINIQDLERSRIFGDVGNGSGEIRNLFFDNLTIAAASSGSGGYGGVIANLNNGYIENVRVRNAHVSAAQYLGILVGRATDSMIRGCSVEESTLEDIQDTRIFYVGGLVGRMDKCGIEDCYTRDVDIIVDNAAACSGQGVLIGYMHTSVALNNYAHGTITTSAQYAGGLVGQGPVSAGSLYHNWSYVDIYQTGGSYAAGLSGRSASKVMNGLAIGDVISTGGNLRRVGFDHATVFAYEDQTVTGLEPKEDNKPVKGPESSIGLLTTKQLHDPDVWSSKVGLGMSFDYSGIRGTGDVSVAPKLCYDAARAEWKQKDIILPGSGGEHTLEVQKNLYSEPNGKGVYELEALLIHPGIPSDAALHTQIRQSMVLDGMDITDSYAEVYLYPGIEMTTISIKTSKVDKCMDRYEFSLSYKRGDEVEKHRTMVEFKYANGTPRHNYHEISNLREWNSVIEGGHGYTGENFRITGVIDFEEDGRDGNTPFKGLILNRLEGAAEKLHTDGKPVKMVTGASGTAEAVPTVGFVNLAYDPGANGEPWIEKVSKGITNLAFHNVTFNFRATTSTAARERNSAIQYAEGLKNLDIRDMSILFATNSRKRVAFVAYSNGVIQDITLKDVLVQDSGNTGSTVDVGYCGALVAAHHNGAVQNITANNIKIYAPRNSYPGGLFGYMESTAPKVEDIDCTNVNVEGRSYVGGMFGDFPNSNLKLATMTNVTVKAYKSAGGIVGGQLDQAYDLTVTNATITTTTFAGGGIQGGKENTSSQLYNCTVKDSTIKGGSRAGGLVGYYCYRADSCHVWNCTITGTNAGGIVGTIAVYKHNNQVMDCTISGTTSAGGIVGSSHIRLNGQANMVLGCSISASTGNAGGVAGTLSAENEDHFVRKNYIGTNVTITGYGSTGGVVGSLFGLYEFYVNFVGADITSQTIAGGLVGQYNLKEKKTLLLTGGSNYFAGKVTGETFVGGIIGRAELGNEALTTGLTNGYYDLVIGQIECVGASGKVSTWVNHATKASPGDRQVAIWEGVTVNGVTVKALKETPEGNTVNSQGLPTSNYVRPASAKIIQADVLQTSPFYATYMKLNENYTNNLKEQGNVYMPYNLTHPTTYAGSTAQTAYAVMPDGKTKVDAATYRMKIPTAVPEPKLLVYPAGVNTINIEKHFDKWPTEDPVVTIGGVTTPVKLTRVGSTVGITQVPVTAYDSITIDGVPWQNMRRRVMAWGNYWYYLQDGKVFYGNDDAQIGELAMPNLAANASIIHLWQGKALASDGFVYTITINSKGEHVVTKGDAAAPPTAQGYLWQEDSGKVTVYGGHTVITNVYEPLWLQVGYLNDTPYNLSPGQLAVPDSMHLSRSAHDGSTYTRFSYLTDPNQGGDGKIVDELSAINTGTLDTKSGIWQMTGTHGYYGEAIALWSVTGEGENRVESVEVLNYVTGSRIQPPRSRMQRLATFARRAMATLFAPFTDGDAQGGTLEEALEQQALTAGEPGGQGEGGGEASGGGSAPGETQPQSSTGPDGGEASGGTDSGGTDSGPEGGEGSGSSTASGTADPQAEAMQEIFGDTMAVWSGESGGYEVVDTASMVPKPAAQEDEEEPQETTAPEKPQSSFQVNKQQSQNFYSGHRSGFLFLGGAAAAIALILLGFIILFIKKEK